MVTPVRLVTSVSLVTLVIPVIFVIPISRDGKCHGYDGYIRVKSGLLILVRVKDLTFSNSAYQSLPGQSGFSNQSCHSYQSGQSGHSSHAVSLVILVSDKALV